MRDALAAAIHTALLGHTPAYPACDGHPHRVLDAYTAADAVLAHQGAQAAEAARADEAPAGGQVAPLQNKAEAALTYIANPTITYLSPVDEPVSNDALVWADLADETALRHTLKNVIWVAREASADPQQRLAS